MGEQYLKPKLSMSRAEKKFVFWKLEKGFNCTKVYRS